MAINDCLERGIKLWNIGDRVKGTGRAGYILYKARASTFSLYRRSWTRIGKSCRGKTRKSRPFKQKVFISFSNKFRI